jgi:uncharacterized protein YecE (DUF72 family)
VKLLREAQVGVGVVRARPSGTEAAAVADENRYRAGLTPRRKVAVMVPAAPIPVMADAVLVGTQGWNYAQWVGPFYPEGTRAEDFLRLYARAFATVEVDSTFYAVPPAKVVASWAGKVGAGFRFALKLPRAITHERRLVDSGEPLAEFLASARLLGEKLGPVLVQFGPDFGPEQRPALARFLPQLPGDVRFAVEFRRRGWLIRPVLDLLRDYGVALALVEGRWLTRAKLLRLSEQPTADFSYVRFMGPDRSIEDYSRIQVDRSDDLATWVPALKALAERVRSVYVYCNNHFEGHSPETARKLLRFMGMTPVEPDRIADQTELF